jgi:hypothetical protein
MLSEERQEHNDIEELKAFKEIQKRLCVSTNRGECVDFSDAAERHGYTTECLPSRAGYCASLLAHSKCSGVEALRLLLLSSSTTPLLVSAIGEGPGFSAVGISAFMLFYAGDATKTLEYSCCDYEEGWIPFVKIMGQVIARANSAICGTNVRLNLSFRMCDVRYGMGHEKNSDLLAATGGKLADVFIFSFVLVENAEHLRRAGWQFVKELLGGTRTAGGEEREGGASGCAANGDSCVSDDGKPRVAILMDSTHRIFPELHDALTGGGSSGTAAATAAERVNMAGQATTITDSSDAAAREVATTTNTSDVAARETSATTNTSVAYAGWSAHLPSDKGPSVPRNKMLLLNSGARVLAGIVMMGDGQDRNALPGTELGYHQTVFAQSLDEQFAQMRMQSTCQADWLRHQPQKAPAGPENVPPLA